MLIGPSLILYWVVVVGTITPLAIRLLVPFRVSSETNGSAVIVLGTESAEVEIAFSSRTTQVLPQFLPVSLLPFVAWSVQLTNLVARVGIPGSHQICCAHRLPMVYFGRLLVI
jgi:hypothetical protein